MDDVITLICDDHVLIRRLFRELKTAREDASRRCGLWTELAALLLAHLDAAEEICYLPFLNVAPGGLLAIAELRAHRGDICDAVAEARLREEGSSAWWLAARAARDAADRHINYTESCLLPRVRQELPNHTLRELGRQWQRFMGDLQRDGR